MTIDTQLRTQLTSAVDGTTVPPGLARTALAGGRARRRRRAVGGGALLAAVVAGGVMVLPGLGESAGDVQPAEGRSAVSTVGLNWARTLHEGRATTLPFFGAGGDLWSDGQRYAVPAEVNRSQPPRPVLGGWLVTLGPEQDALALAVLGTDGTLRDLPAETVDRGFADTRVEVSADGTRVAFGRWWVDLATMTATEVPHQPESDEQDGYYTGIRMVGWTDEGLAYEGAPFVDGIGTTWLLRDDGTTVPFRVPDGAHVRDGGPASVAVRFDYTDDESDTCVSSWRLRGATWTERAEACMGQYLGEALAISPDGRYLLTDDLPRLWDLENGEWVSVDVPQRVVDSWTDESWLSRPVWEDADTLLIPVADRWTGDVTPEPTFTQRTQLVRCTISTGECERAGNGQEIRVESTMWGSTELRLAGQ